MLVALFFLLFSMKPEAILGPMDVPRNTRQIVLVETDSWISPTGELQMLSRSPHGWIAVGARIPISVGQKGLAWGRGVQQAVTEGPQKVEGDGKGPAGVFRFGTAFGYDAEAPADLKLPYRQATDRDYYVDDPNSPDYNHWATLPNATSTPSWRSAENMKRKDYLYELGIVVQQNTDPVVAGKGSAVFLHIWRNPGSATAGCTAMSKADLTALMKWLDPAKEPLLIQAPGSEMNRIKMAAPPK
jgi:L,D-peptidoglycan transpeptidase YkuD (ErfK/YbiS/YcfS/YnhG family)